jgi:hypothetical protein
MNMDMLDDYVEKFRIQTELFFRGNDKDGLIELDRNLSGLVTSGLRPAIWGRPYLAFAYLHPGYVQVGYEFIEIDGEGNRDYTLDFFRVLNGVRGEQGLLRQIAGNLPRQSGLVKRESNNFILRLNTVIPRPDKKDVHHYFPMVSLCTIGTCDDYPGNKKHSSVRARRDVFRIGARVLDRGFKFSDEKPLVPFWVSSDVYFKGIPTTEEQRINNMGFLRSAYSFGMRR